MFDLATPSLFITLAVLIYAFTRYYKSKRTLPTNFKIIGVTGLKFNGKDTIANYFCNKYGFTRVAFADPLKTICGTLFGFNYEQLHGSLKETPDTEWFNLTPRKVLQYVGTDLFRTHMVNLHADFGDNFWLLCAEKIISDIKKKYPNACIVISDVRFPNECEMIKRLGGVVIRVNRPNINKTTDLHESEQAISKLRVDFEVINGGTVSDLHAGIENILKTQ